MCVRMCACVCTMSILLLPHIQSHDLQSFKTFGGCCQDFGGPESHTVTLAWPVMRGAKGRGQWNKGWRANWQEQRPPAIELEG